MTGDEEYILQRQIDTLGGKVDRLSDQVKGIRELLDDKLDRIRAEADIDRRSFQQALSTMNTQLERNTQAMSGTETRVALLEVDNNGVRKGLDTLSNRLWWVAGTLFTFVLAIAADIFKSLPV